MCCSKPLAPPSTSLFLVRLMRIVLWTWIQSHVDPVNISSTGGHPDHLSVLRNQPEVRSKNLVHIQVTCENFQIFCLIYCRSTFWLIFLEQCISTVSMRPSTGTCRPFYRDKGYFWNYKIRYDQMNFIEEDKNHST